MIRHIWTVRFDGASLTIQASRHRSIVSGVMSSSVRSPRASSSLRTVNRQSVSVDALQERSWAAWHSHSAVASARRVTGDAALVGRPSGKSGDGRILRGDYRGGLGRERG